MSAIDNTNDYINKKEVDYQNEIVSLKEKVNSLETKINELADNFKLNNVDSTSTNNNAILTKSIESITNYQFDEYKQKVNRDDLEKLNNLKIKWTYFIPIAGLYIWSYYEGIMLSSLDRGYIRKLFLKYQAQCFLIFLPIFFIAWPLSLTGINVLPFFDIFFVIKKVNKIYNLENKNL